MAERNRGLRRILSNPHWYSSFQSAVTRGSIWPEIFQEHIRKPESNCRILDIGCGPGKFLSASQIVVDQSNYVGIDPSGDYIQAARESFPMATFHHGTVDQVDLVGKTFDVVILSGVLHHVDDTEAHAILKFANSALAEGGIVTALDPVLLRQQNPIARLLVLADRGMHVRTPEAMETIFSSPGLFSEISAEIRDNLLWVPYSHILNIARRGTD